MFSEEVQRVYEEIKNGILDETYEPGRALPEIPLAQKYGVKRTRIRQIFQKLERDTLVEIIPARGAFVKPISMIEFQEIFEIREALEGIAARLAARKRRDEDIEKIIKEFEALKDDQPDDNLEGKVRTGGARVYSPQRRKQENYQYSGTTADTGDENLETRHSPEPRKNKQGL
jgi:DNA-binding GntR family transcriptional regulator